MTTEMEERFTGKVYINLSDAARLMGVTKQRIFQLLHDDPTFPVAKVRVSNAFGWTTEQIQRYDARRNKTTGRPKKVR